MTRSYPHAALLLMLAGCAPSAQEAPCGEGEILDGETCVPQACGEGPWGTLPITQDTTYVQADAAPDGDGSWERPYRRIQDGLDGSSGGLVAVAAGTYVETLELDQDNEGTHLAGRCEALVTVDGSEGEELEPGVLFLGGSSSSPLAFSLSGLTVHSAAQRGIEVFWADVEIEGVTVSSSTRHGLLVYESELFLRDVLVEGSRAPSETGEFGRGLEAQASTIRAEGLTLRDNQDLGMRLYRTEAELHDTEILETRARGYDDQQGRGLSMTESQLEASRLRIHGNRDFGVFLQASTAELSDSIVSGTQPELATGGNGVGILASEGSTLTATGLDIRGNRDAGIISRSGSELRLSSSVVAETQLAQWSESGWSGGAGIRAGDSLLELSDVELLDNAELGADLQGGCDVSASGLTVARNVRGGLRISSAEASILDSTVEESLPDPRGQAGSPSLLGYGIQLSDSVLQAEGLIVRGNQSAGIVSYRSQASLVDSRIEQTLPDAGHGFNGSGLLLVEGSELSGQGLVVHANHGSGIGLIASSLSLVDSTVSETRPVLSIGSWGSGIYLSEESTLSGSNVELRDNHNVGLFFNTGSTGDLQDFTVTGTGRSFDSKQSAKGVLAQLGSSVIARNLSVLATAGPGLGATVSSSLECQDCVLQDNRFSGAVVSGATLRLENSTVSGTRPDPNLGGGVGIFSTTSLAKDPDFPPDLPARASVLHLEGSSVSDNTLAGVYIRGSGSHSLIDSEISGSPGIDARDGVWGHGDAVFATEGVRAWDDSSSQGLRIVGSTLRDAQGSGLFLHGSSAWLSGNSWQDNDVDVVQQACSAVAATPVDLSTESVQDSLLCPEYDLYFDALEYSVAFSELDLAP